MAFSVNACIGEAFGAIASRPLLWLGLALVCVTPDLGYLPQVVPRLSDETPIVPEKLCMSLSVNPERIGLRPLGLPLSPKLDLPVSQEASQESASDVLTYFFLSLLSAAA